MHCAFILVPSLASLASASASLLHRCHRHLRLGDSDSDVALVWDERMSYIATTAALHTYNCPLHPYPSLCLFPFSVSLPLCLFVCLSAFLSACLFYPSPRPFLCLPDGVFSTLCISMRLQRGNPRRRHRFAAPPTMAKAAINVLLPHFLPCAAYGVARVL